VPRQLEKRQELWAGFWEARQQLGAALDRLSMAK
jgi:hypothetical protein